MADDGVRTLIWHLSHRGDEKARLVADRHYNRQKIGTPQFVPPGRCLVLYANVAGREALWVTSYPFAEYVRHAWAGAWMCSAFRNEGAGVASEMIVEAVACTRWLYGDPPLQGMVTFIDETKVKPIRRRGADAWGYTYEKTGFAFVGRTKGNLMAFQLLPEKVPPSESPSFAFADCGRLARMMEKLAAL